MGKYRVDTQNGSYIVETDGTSPSAPQSVPTTLVKYPAQTPPEGSAGSRFMGGLVDNTIGGIKNAVVVGKHLYDAAFGGGNPQPLTEDLKNIYNASADQAQKAKQEFQRGNYVEAAGHALGTVPVLGPAAARAGERIGGVQPTYDKYGNVIQPGQAPDIAGGLGETAGLVLGASPRNITGPALGKIAQAAGKMPVPERFTPEGLYQSALRPSLSSKNLPNIPQQVQTGLNEKIPVSSSGLAKTDAAIDAVNDEIANKIQEKSQELGPVVSPKSVASRVESVRPEFDTVNPEADQSAISSSKNEFLNKHSYEAPYTKVAPMAEVAPEEGTQGFTPVGQGSTTVEKPITLLEAQAEKQRTYTQLRKKYGELASATVESQKALARGLKEEIASRTPELSALNARDGALMDLQTQLERMVAREGNKNLLGLVPATMSQNPFKFLATLVMDNPIIKSKLAIALNRARQVITAKGMGATGAGGTTAATIGAALNVNSPGFGQLPQYAQGGIIKRPTLLTDLATGKPSGIMAEKGPEKITPLAQKLIRPQVQKFRPPSLSRGLLIRKE